MLQSIGLGVLLVFIPLGVLGILALLQFLWTAAVPIGGLLLLGGLLSVHYQRGDRFFLEQLTPHLLGIYALEYGLLSSPLLFFFGRWGQWWNVGLVLVGLLLLSLVRPPYRQRQRARRSVLEFPVAWIPPFLWEWRMGLRKHAWWLLPLYLGGLWGASYTAATPVLALLFALVVSSFYQPIAPLEIIQASNSDGRFLIRKVGQSLLFFQGLLLPHYLLFIVLQGSWQVALGVVALMVVSASWISFSICLQYSSYDYESEQVTNLLPLGMFVGGTLLPFFWLLLPFFWIYYWRKAHKQLNYYA